MTVPLNQTMANDNIYLVNFDIGGSAMCLYNNKAWSVGGEKPDQVIVTSSSPIFTTWEGQQITGNLWLPFITNIAAGSDTQPAGTQVGTAQQIRASMLPSNVANIPNARAWAIYNIFRDNNRVLFSDPVLGNAISLYVCADVSFPSLLDLCQTILNP
jgi:hypothetical protein